MARRSGEKSVVKIEVAATPETAYLTDDYFELDLSVAAAVIVDEKVTAAHEPITQLQADKTGKSR